MAVGVEVHRFAVEDHVDDLRLEPAFTFDVLRCGELSRRSESGESAHEKQDRGGRVAGPEWSGALPFPWTDSCCGSRRHRTILHHAGRDRELRDGDARGFATWRKPGARLFVRPAPRQGPGRSVTVVAVATIEIDEFTTERSNRREASRKLVRRRVRWCGVAPEPQPAVRRSTEWFGRDSLQSRVHSDPAGLAVRTVADERLRHDTGERRRRLRSEGVPPRPSSSSPRWRRAARLTRSSAWR